MTVTLEHEGLALLFRNRPTLSAELLTQVFGIALPSFVTARMEATDLTRVVPDQFFADAALVYYDATGKAVFAALAEVQRKEDAQKKLTWPVYVSVLRAQHCCPVWLLVLAPTPSVARWAAEPIALGHPGFVLTPLVLTAEHTPLITDPAQARGAPELAVLSAMMHGASERGAEVALAAYEGIASAFLGKDDDRLRVYQDLIDSSLSQAARQALEALMANGNYQYQGEFAKRYVAEGKAEGKAEAILAVLEARGLSVSEAERARIVGCTDINRLGAWVRRAATIATTVALFDDSGAPRPS